MTVELLPAERALAAPAPAPAVRSAPGAQLLRAIAGVTVMLGLWLVLFRSEAASEFIGGLAIAVGLALTVVAECLRVVRRRRATA